MSDTVNLIIEIPKPMYENIQNGTFCGTLYKELKKAKLYETVTEFADRCRECGREKVLDKIRAEIEQVKSIMNEEIINHDRKDLINFVNGLNQSLVIIDKYTAESEE